jgi:predicted house-cleaning NTP pyrophosphatase (Maf/HAM1 superfamily)
MEINDIKNFNTDKALECILNKEKIEFEKKTLVLASASKSRKGMLEAANIKFVIIPNLLEEDLIKTQLGEVNTQSEAEEYVKILSKSKAQSISDYIKNAIIFQFMV